MIAGSKNPTLNSTRTKLLSKKSINLKSYLELWVDFLLLRGKTIYQINKIPLVNQAEKKKKMKEEKKYN